MLTLRQLIILATVTALGSGQARAYAGTQAIDAIRVQSATWSGRSVLEAAKKHCEEGDKSSCNYLVSPRYIGEATDPGNRSFSIAWACTSNPTKIQTVQLPHDATNKSIALTCPIPEPKEAPKPGKPHRTSNYKYSFRNLVLNHAFESVIEPDLGRACLATVRKILSDGYVLRSKILEPLIVPLSSKVAGLKLYHRTQVESVRDSLNAFSTLEDKTDYLFKFVRTRDATALWNHSESFTGKSQDYRRFGWRNFYTASSPSGSSEYGPIMITLSLDPEAKIMLYDLPKWQKAVADLVEQFPEIGTNCVTRFDGGKDTMGSLQFQNFIPFMAEEMGAQVLDYNQADTWFCLLYTSPSPRD